MKKNTKKTSKKVAYKDCWYHPSHLVEELVPCNAYDFKIWADIAIDNARMQHKRIPFDQIGEAICKKIDGKSYRWIAKFFMNDERLK